MARATTPGDKAPRIPSLFARVRENAKGVETAGLWWILIGTLVFAVPLTWGIGDHAYTHAVTSIRGVETQALVTSEYVFRGSTTYTVSFAGATSETPAIAVPTGTEVGDVITVRYDPADSARVVADGAPLLSLGLVVIILLDLVVLPVTLICWPIALLEIVRRRREDRPRASSRS